MSFYHIRAKECAEYTTTIYCVAVQKNQQKQSTQSLIPFHFLGNIFFSNKLQSQQEFFSSHQKHFTGFFVCFSTFKQALCNWYTAQIRT